MGIARCRNRSNARLLRLTSAEDAGGFVRAITTEHAGILDVRPTTVVCTEVGRSSSRGTP